MQFNDRLGANKFWTVSGIFTPPPPNKTLIHTLLDWEMHGLWSETLTMISGETACSESAAFATLQAGRCRYV